MPGSLPQKNPICAGPGPLWLYRPRQEPGPRTNGFLLRSVDLLCGARALLLLQTPGLYRPLELARKLYTSFRRQQGARESPP